MVNHGVSTAALFLIAGFLVSRRGAAPDQRLRRCAEGCACAGRHLPGRRSRRRLVLNSSASRQFHKQFLVLIGTFTHTPVFAVFAATALVLSAVYILWMYQQMR